MLICIERICALVDRRFRSIADEATHWSTILSFCLVSIYEVI